MISLMRTKSPLYKGEKGQKRRNPKAVKKQVPVRRCVAVFILVGHGGARILIVLHIDWDK